MKSREPRWPVAIFLVLLSSLTGLPSLVLAQEEPAASQQEEPASKAAQPAAEGGEEEPEEPARFDQEIVVTGSRSQPRSVTESMVPIDVVSKEDFQDLGET